MDVQAKALGMSRNEMILKSISMLLDFDPTFYKKLEAYSNNTNVSMGTALQNMTEQFKVDTVFQYIKICGEAISLQSDREAVWLGVSAGIIESFF